MQLSCVQDVGAFRAAVGEPLLSPERRWSASQHSGAKPYKVAEFDNLMTEFTDEGAVEHNKFVEGLEAQLCDCFDAIAAASEIAEVQAAQDALKCLKQPLVDELRRQKLGRGASVGLRARQRLASSVRRGPDCRTGSRTSKSRHHRQRQRQLTAGCHKR